MTSAPCQRFYIYIVANSITSIKFPVVTADNPVNTKLFFQLQVKCHWFLKFVTFIKFNYNLIC